MKQVPEDYFEDGYYYPPAPIMETMGIVIVISLCMIAIIPLSFYFSRFVSI